MALVVLDPGHGKNTPGKRSPDGSLREYEFNQVVADLAEEILKSHGVDVIVTKRMNDNDISLSKRCQIANDAKADIFLSIHANAHINDWTSARGWEVYSYPGSKSGAALSNLAVRYGYSEVAKYNVPKRGDGSKTANFAVVRETRMPAILFEWAFFTNKTECALLKREDFRMSCAIGTVKTVLAHFGIAYKGSATNKPKPETKKDLNGKVIHTVISGDTLWDISRKYSVSVDQIKSLNGLKSDIISVGDVLIIKNEVKSPEPRDEYYRLFVGGKQVHAITVKENAYAEGWRLYNAGKKDVILVAPNGAKFTYDKHQSENPSKPVVEPKPKPEINGTPILGQPELEAHHLDSYVRTKNPNAPEVAQYFIELGKEMGIRGDIAFFQSVKETGWFKFGGDVTLDQNNYSGLGTTGGGVKGAYFETPRQGVLAQLQHLWAYATNKNLPSDEKLVDPRFHLVSPKGKAPTWEELAGKWAVPGYNRKTHNSLEEALQDGKTYGQEILALYEEAKKFNPPAKEPMREDGSDKTEIVKRVETNKVQYNVANVEGEIIPAVIIDGNGYVDASSIAKIMGKRALWDKERNEIVIVDIHKH